jgi:hypothetical protein
LPRSEEGVTLNELCLVVSSAAIDREPALQSADQVAGVSITDAGYSSEIWIAFMHYASRGDIDNVRKTGNDRYLGVGWMVMDTP